MIEVGRTDVFNKWFERLRDENAQARIARRIDRLEAGNPGDMRFVGGGVSEMRIDYGLDIDSTRRARERVDPPALWR